MRGGEDEDGDPGEDLREEERRGRGRERGEGRGDEDGDPGEDLREEWRGEGGGGARGMGREEGRGVRKRILSRGERGKPLLDAAHARRNVRWPNTIYL